MIISHARRFIFIKTYKTAGTSLEIVLSKYCSPGDVITPLVPDEEELRSRVSSVGPGNYSVDPKKRGWKKRLISRVTGRSPARFLEHSPAWKVRRDLEPEIWNSYFKFAVVRHPVDRLISRYYYSRDYAQETGRSVYWDVDDFDQFLRYRASQINENWSMYTERDKVTLDYMVRYEELEAGLAVVSDRIGLDHNLFDDLRDVRAKGQHRPRSVETRDLITDRRRTLIKMLCEKEIELFGYDV